MLIAAVVILYNPEDNVRDNILSYNQEVSKVYVIDNSEKTNKRLVARINEIPNCIYLSDNVNEGISKRLNQAIEFAEKDGFDCLLTMDQDSYFEPGVCADFFSRIRAYKKIESIAMFATNYQPKIIKYNTTPRFVPSTITSGTVMYLKNCKEVGAFNEEMFIDLVDAEYSYRVTAKKYQILLYPDIILTHKLGIVEYHRSLKNFKLTPRILHSPTRIYYLVRNSYYLLHNFPDLSDIQKKEIKKCLLLLKNNILYSKYRRKVIFFALKGYLDAKNNVMGKLPN